MEKKINNNTKTQNINDKDETLIMETLEKTIVISGKEFESNNKLNNPNKLNKIFNKFKNIFK